MCFPHTVEFFLSQVLHSRLYSILFKSLKMKALFLLDTLNSFSLKQEKPKKEQKLKELCKSVSSERSLNSSLRKSEPKNNLSHVP